MNRREMLQAAAVSLASAALPAAKDLEPQGEPLDLISTDEQLPEIYVICQWSMADQAWLIAAYCYGQPVACFDTVTMQEVLLEKNNGCLYWNDEVIAARKEKCRQELARELRLLR